MCSPITWNLITHALKAITPVDDVMKSLTEVLPLLHSCIRQIDSNMSSSLSRMVN